MLDTTPTLTHEELEDHRDRFAARLAQTVPGRKEFVVAEAEDAPSSPPTAGSTST